MQPETLKLLTDAEQAGERIREFTTKQSLDDYKSNAMLRLAVERLFEIVGEALTRLAKMDSVTASQITGYRQIIDFRNVISHGYDAIKDEIVWDAIQYRLPVLLNEIRALYTAPGP